MLVEDQTTCLLVDCGFSVRETEARLERLGRSAASLSGILVTHEHADHCSGVFRLARKHALPVWLTGGTYRSCQPDTDGVDCRLIDSHRPFSINDLLISPFPVPHDAREPVQYVFSDGCYRLGLLTDVGEVTAHIVSMLSGCHALVLEFNHDARMLANSSYPPHLKRRIAGRQGHLENRAALELLQRLDASQLRFLVAAHLSERNNQPELVSGLLAEIGGKMSAEIVLACQAEGFSWLELN